LNTGTAGFYFSDGTMRVVWHSFMPLRWTNSKKFRDILLDNKHGWYVWI